MKVSRGRMMPSARASQGETAVTTFSKSTRLSERSVMILGSHGLIPSINWALRNSSGAPTTAETPGGIGSAVGTAKMNSSAPNARRRSALSRSPIEMRSLSCA